MAQAANASCTPGAPNTHGTCQQRSRLWATHCAVQTGPWAGAAGPPPLPPPAPPAAGPRQRAGRAAVAQEATGQSFAAGREGQRVQGGHKPCAHHRQGARGARRRLQRRCGAQQLLQRMSTHGFGCLKGAPELQRLRTASKCGTGAASRVGGPLDLPGSQCSSTWAACTTNGLLPSWLGRSTNTCRSSAEVCALHYPPGCHHSSSIQSPAATNAVLSMLSLRRLGEPLLSLSRNPR